MKAMLLATAALIGLSACSGDVLITKDEEGKKPISGVAVRRIEPWVIQGKLYQSSAKDAMPCKPTPFIQTVNLASGDVYYVRPKTSLLAQTAFTVKIAPDGSLSELTLNSTPAASTALDAVTNAIVKLAPLAVGLAAQNVELANDTTKNKPPKVEAKYTNIACDTGPVAEHIVTLAAFKAAIGSGN